MPIKEISCFFFKDGFAHWSKKSRCDVWSKAQSTAKFMAWVDFQINVKEPLSLQPTTAIEVFPNVTKSTENFDASKPFLKFQNADQTPQVQEEHELEDLEAGVEDKVGFLIAFRKCSNAPTTLNVQPWSTPIQFTLKSVTATEILASSISEN